MDVDEGLRRIGLVCTAIGSLLGLMGAIAVFTIPDMSELEKLGATLLSIALGVGLPFGFFTGLRWIIKGFKRE